MAVDRGRGVAECFGDDGYSGEFGEFVKCSEPGCPATEDRAEPLSERRGSKVLTWRPAAEHPVAVGVRCCLIVGRGGCEFSPGLIERRRECDLDGSAGDRDQILCHLDVMPRQLDDVGNLLAKDQNEDGRCSVPRAHVGRVAEAVDELCLSGCIETWAGAATVGLQFQ